MPPPCSSCARRGRRLQPSDPSQPIHDANEDDREDQQQEAHRRPDAPVPSLQDLLFDVVADHDPAVPPTSAGVRNSVNNGMYTRISATKMPGAASGIKI